jgi:hypothetical protein
VKWKTSSPEIRCLQWKATSNMNQHEDGPSAQDTPAASAPPVWWFPSRSIIPPATIGPFCAVWVPCPARLPALASFGPKSAVHALWSQLGNARIRGRLPPGTKKLLAKSIPDTHFHTCPTYVNIFQSWKS